MRPLHLMRDNKGKYGKLVPTIFQSEYHRAISFVSIKKYVELVRVQLVQLAVDNITQQWQCVIHKCGDCSTWWRLQALSLCLLCGGIVEKFDPLFNHIKWPIYVNDFRELLDEDSELYRLPTSQTPQAVKHSWKQWNPLLLDLMFSQRWRNAV
jgi:hypothetical protein